MLELPKLPSLIAIQAFEAAARHGSFAAAARELGTSAASVSYHIKQLEQQIGAALFRRMAHRVELTDPGRIAAEEAITAFDSLRGGFVRASEMDKGRLNVSALPTFASTWLVPKLGDFRTSHPSISISVDTSIDAKDLSIGVTDVAIRNGHGKWRGLRSIYLFPAIFTPLCSPALAAAAASPDGLKASPLPLLGRRDWWELWCRASGIDWRPGDERFGTNLATEQLDMAAAIAGQGIAIGSPILFQDEIDAGRLIMPRPLTAGDGRAFWLTYPAGRHDHPKIGAFREWLARAAHLAHERASPIVRDAIVLEPSNPREFPIEVVT